MWAIPDSPGQPYRGWAVFCVQGDSRPQTLAGVRCAMTTQESAAHGRPEESGQGAAGSRIQTFHLGDYGLIDVVGAPPSHRVLQRALLSEWSTSSAGVILQIDTHPPLDDQTVLALTADAAALVQAWPGTPIGFISPRRELRTLVARHPQGHHVATGTDLTDIWGGLWSLGGKWGFTIELPPTGQAPRTARDIVVRACADWDLDPVAESAAQLTNDLVARSVRQGARDIHFTVSRHQSRIRIVARDDVPSTLDDELMTIDDAFGLSLAPPTLTSLADSLGEFTLDGHHVRWAVTRDHPAL